VCRLSRPKFATLVRAHISIACDLECSPGDSEIGVNPWFWTAIRGLTFIPNEVIEQESDG
jgi:hypothetical protein